MPVKDFNELIRLVQKAEKKKKVAVISAHDEHTLEAVLKARSNGLVTPILIGDAAKIRAILRKRYEDIDQKFLIDIQSEKDAAARGVQLVNQGLADFVMKGKIQTADLLKAVVDKENGLRTEGIMSHIAINEVPNYHKLLVTTDGGMVMYPDLAQKKMILENALRVLKKLGYDNPKVAVLAATETVNPQMPESLDAAALKEMNVAGEIGGCIVEGPISYDLAVSRDSAEAKGYQSPVAGDADLLLVPNITAGNILGKALLFSGGARMAGLVIGARVPVVLTSRGATADEKYLSLVLAAAF